MNFFNNFCRYFWYLLIITYINQITFNNYVFGWNLSTLSINDYQLFHVSVYYIRSFLCIKSTEEGKHTPTLIESSWPENLLPILPKVYPNDLSHSNSKTDCNGIVQAIGTTIDHQSYLWVLDEGSLICPPKLIAYQLLKWDEEVHRSVFSKFYGVQFTSITTDSGILSNINDSRIILTVQDEPYLVVYSMNMERWQRLVPTIIGRTIIPIEIVFQKATRDIYILDENNSLWRNKRDIPFIDKRKKFPVMLLGHLLGQSKLLSSNSDNCLYYYLPRDGAVLRWDITKPLKAEGHTVIYQSPIDIVQIIFGAKGSVWIVQNDTNSFGDHCSRTSSIFESFENLS